MCGFVAWLSPNAAVTEALLCTMRDQLFHRGPDRGANWITSDATVGLGFRRLAILDLAQHADQPMARADGALQIVFNGEIYNYKELRHELEALGARFTTESDTEVLLTAYEYWGTACVARLNGMFAFALWDEANQQLFVARDRFGEKPLFYTRTADGEVLFASEMKALLLHPDVPATPNQNALARFAAGQWLEDDTSSFFEGITRMAPAHAALYSRDGNCMRQWRYWEPVHAAASDHTASAQSAEDDIQTFRTLLEKSVTQRLQSDVPVGSSLSGGLDSSAIVGIIAAQRQQQQPSQQATFSACFEEDPTLSETPFIDAVANHNSVASYRVNPTAEGLMEESLQLHWHQEEPFLSASIYLQWCVARLAKEHHVTVLLDGQGADELLAGYQFWFKQHQLDLIDRKRYVRALLETWCFNRRLRLAARLYRQSHRRFNTRTAYSMWQCLALCIKRPPVWHGSYVHGVPAAVPGQRMRRTLAEALQYTSLPMLLRYADRNAMAFSREGRMPYLDHALVDYCLTLPMHRLIRWGWQKWILRQASDGLMPEHVRWRADKVGYAAPLDLWLRGALKDWAHARIFSEECSSIPGYDAAALTQLWQEHQSGEVNHSWALWRWISLYEWIHLLQTGIWKKPTPFAFAEQA